MKSPIAIQGDDTLRKALNLMPVNGIGVFRYFMKKIPVRHWNPDSKRYCENLFITSAQKLSHSANGFTLHSSKALIYKPDSKIEESLYSLERLGNLFFKQLGGQFRDGCPQAL